MQHEVYMKRCLELAKTGLPLAMPNPSVGAVLVYNSTIIGEGFTSPYGGNHAEVNAINAVKDKTLLCKSTLYVSLEPCSHYGKTPPCSDLVIHSKIPNVVIGTIDPHSKVAGKGVLKLVSAGITVVVGILEKECQEFNKRFFTFHTKKRPYVILKWAESLDGFLAPLTKNKKEPVWISNSISRQLVHKWRSEEQAILVGTNTVLEDNPKLNTRNWHGKNPTRIVIDRTLKLNSNYNCLDQSVNTIIITEKENLISTSKIIYETIIFDKNIIFNILKTLHKHNLQSVIVEGGLKTLQSLIDVNLWDEARVFKSNILFKTGINAPILLAINKESHTIINDELLIFKNDD